MPTRRMPRRLALASLIAASIPGAALAAPFTNGGFEQGPSTGGGFVTLPNGSTAITGWTISAGDMDYIGAYWQAGEGVRSLDMVGCQQGSISQTFDTLPRARYLVSFLMAGNPDAGPTVKALRASAAGTVRDFTFDITGSTRADMRWSPRSFIFEAVASSTTLTFSNTSDFASCAGATLDGVSVTLDAPPPPAFIPVDGAPWLWLLGLGVLGVVGWRMRPQGA